MQVTVAVDDAYNRARASYTQHLNAEECAHINAPTSLSALLSQAQAIGDVLDRDRGTSSAVRTLGERMNTFANFEKFLEGACKTSPVAGELIWGSVSFILQDNAAVFEEVWDFFQSMAEEIEHLRLQEQTFAASPLVQSVLEAVYSAILDFWEVLSFKTKRLSGSIENLRIVELPRQKISAVQHHAQSASFFDESKHLQQSAHQWHLKEWVNAPDYDRDFRVASIRRYPGTCEWLQRKPAFIEWTTSDPKPFLFIYGIPGARKTVLSSWIIGEAPSLTTGDNFVLFHYFTDTDTDKRTPVSAIRSMLDQLLNHYRSTSDPLLVELESSLNKMSLERSRHVDYPDLYEILSSSVSSWTSARRSTASHVISVVLDALYECQSPHALVNDFLKLAEQSQGQFRVVATGRKSAWDSIEVSITSLSHPTGLQISVDNIQADIDAYVRHTISSIPPLSNHEHLRELLCKEIAKPDNHQGMFLWVFLVCEEVKRQGYVKALRKLLTTLPTGLDAMYTRICKVIVDRDEGLGFSLSVLQWIFNSPRPLQFSELQEGLRAMREQNKEGFSVAEDDDWFDGTSDLLWSRQDIVDACGNLITYTGIDKGDSFVLVHLTANSFFRQTRTQSYLTSQGLETIRTFIEDVQTAEPTLGILCIDYLLLDALQSHGYMIPTLSLTPPPTSHEDNFEKQYPLFHYAVIHWTHCPPMFSFSIFITSKRRSPCNDYVFYFPSIQDHLVRTLRPPIEY
ncbi:hypothetical protein H0H87_012574 [Tephrocybe sp. NHM501043]|nr:hypothetical protein H0H87_012574 [Tephrocybe sp. NHM501043]